MFCNIVGGVNSPLLSNIYLDPLDHATAAAGIEMIRYADDFVLLCRSEQAAREALRRAEHWTAEAGLTLHPTKTRLDKWIRMRLRSILRKRHHGSGHGYGKDHFRWPNRYFAARGLFSLVAAHCEVSQSSRR